VGDLIVNLRRTLTDDGLDAGPDTIAWHLASEGHVVSVSTIYRQLLAEGLITPEPKKRPRSSYVRFEAELPNETWQSDFTHYPLTTGADSEVLVWLDDHSRYLLSLTAHRRVTGKIVVDTFNRTGATEGFPASTLTDNGLVYTARFAGGKGRTRDHPEELPAEPPHHLREGRTAPPNPQTMVGRTITPARHHCGAPGDAGPVRRRIQRAAPPPVP
jgi:hypothetical protein